MLLFSLGLLYIVDVAPLDCTKYRRCLCLYVGLRNKLQLILLSCCHLQVTGGGGEKGIVWSLG